MIASWRVEAEEAKQLVADFNDGYCNGVIVKIDEELQERKETADKAAAARLEEMDAAEAVPAPAPDPAPADAEAVAGGVKSAGR